MSARCKPARVATTPTLGANAPPRRAFPFLNKARFTRPRRAGAPSLRVLQQQLEYTTPGLATMSNTTRKAHQTILESHEQDSVDKLEEALAKTDLQEDSESSSSSEEKDMQPPRPLHIYTRPQLLHLSKSPLAYVPDGMPPLKEWFGYVSYNRHAYGRALIYPITSIFRDWNEQVGSKKEADTSNNSAGTRDRRSVHSPPYTRLMLTGA